ncbi:MotA/TolQ/ExbB proton channel family protein [Endozoicomonas numazuensis]|uniref:MotA/TolQ/ExbB proton channel domain-containing protein n=1 Tax=Endozoicomonas numazuensis TaxID=1137799 RepID=A0A081NJI9_9GAMM|nr:MotA/TolQ/ExbB proton channel family protein [Endozoicomonas numazuensis]KEQ18612.1 hypothetical protein GZ78_00260 [Endozoicomonas numazuensis]
MESIGYFVTAVFVFFIVAIAIRSFQWKKKGQYPQFVEYAPTLLTTIGIFGTFLGIVLGLLAFDQNNIETSIAPLLGGLKTAFITSLAGMLSSLVLKVLYTTMFKDSHDSMDSVSDASPEAILRTMQAQLSATESLKSTLVGEQESTLLSQIKIMRGVLQSQLNATENLKESLVGNEETTLFGQLKIFRGDINDQMKMSRNLTTELFDAQQAQFSAFTEKLWLKLQDFVDTMSKSATEQVIEALKQVIQDFNNNLTEQFGENFKHLNEAVHKLVEWQESYKLQLEQMNQQYEQGVQAITATESSVAHISEKTQLIPQTMHDLHSVMTVNQQQLSELESHLEAFKEMRDRAVEAVPEIRRQVEETVTDISAAVSTANQHYSELLVESDRYIQNHVQTSEELLNKFATETEKGIDAVGSRLIEGSKAIGESLDTASTDFTESVVRTNENLLGSIQGHMESSETLMSKVVTETEKGIDQAGTRLVESSVAIGQSIDTAATEFTNNTARTNESLQTSSDYLQTQTEIIKQHLADTVSDLNNTLRDMIEKLVNDAQSMNKTMHDANQNLVADTSQVRDSFVKATEQLQKQLADVVEDAAMQQVNQARRTFEAMEEQVRQQVGLTGEAVDSQLKLIDQSMQQEVTRVMTEMGQALAQVTGKFTNDYIKLTQAMDKIVRQQAA